MKKLFLLLAIATIAATGCRSDSDGMNNGANSNGTYNNGNNQNTPPDQSPTSRGAGMNNNQ
jgi:hypothetical protein